MSKDKGPDVLARANEAEQKIRDALNEAGGLGSRSLIYLDDFFSNYKDRPRPDDFVTICDLINEHRLMCLSEHRNGIAGGVAAVVALNPDFAVEWRKTKGMAAIIDSSERLAPPLIDTDINSIGQVDYLWLWWLVTREEVTLSRLLHLSLRQDMVGVMAQDLLVSHVNIERINEAVKIQHLLWKPQVLQIDDPDITLLANTLIGDLSVVCIGRQSDGKIVVVTCDGSRPPSCPPDVVVRLPTAEEKRIYQAILDEAEEP